MTSVSLEDSYPPPLFDVAAVWSTLWRRRLVVIALTLLVIVLAALYIGVTKPTYTAGAAVLIDPRDVKTTNIDSVLAGIGADSAAIASQVSVIQSRELLDAVFTNLKLETDPEYTSTGIASQLMGMLRPAKPLDREAIFQRFTHSVSVEREGLTYVIDVTVKAGDPVKAAAIANAIVDRYIASNAAQRANATADVATALNDKIGPMQDAVADAERAIEDFKQANQIFDDSTGGALKGQVDSLSGQVLAAQEALNQSQSRYDQALAAGTSASALSQLSNVYSSPALEGLRADYNTRSTVLASAQATYGPKHPNVIAAQAEVAKVQTLIGREAARIAAELKSDRDLAQANLDKAQAELARLRGQSEKTDLATVGLRQLQRKADAARAVLSDFMQRSQETSQMNGLQNSQVHVISSAAPPPDPTWPKPMLLLPVSAVLGLLLGSGVALMLGEGRARVAAVAAPSPSPTPAPVDPVDPVDPIDPKPRRTKKPEHTNIERSAYSAARRYAQLDNGRRELTNQDEAPVQAVLRQIIRSLPKDRNQYIISFSSVRDAALATEGAELTAMGLELIGGRPVVLTGERIDNPAEHSFILVALPHELAHFADLNVLVLTREEATFRPQRDNGQIVLVLDAVAPRVHVASNENLATRLAV
jgi:uncharacterized protein involved in exopolysaccharide biosynthesis